MKKIIILIIASSITAFTAENKNPSTPTEKFSYAVGMQIGNDFKTKEVEIDFEKFIAGVKAAYLSDVTLITEDDAKVILEEAWKSYQAKAKAKRDVIINKNKKEGNEFLTKNRKKTGVKTTASGLQFRIIKTGKGAKPTSKDTVEVHYRGWTTDGKEFDSSYSRGKTSNFVLNRVIRGWTEAITKMSPGAKWEIVVPQNLAYGPRGNGSKIPPYSTLRFEIELISIEKKVSDKNKLPTSNVVRIPSSEDIKKGAKPEVLTKEQIENLKKNK
ncbi:MAG: peptidylprolyl isomerase [Verrucomicrobiales bacterium]|nr:peptidylprolyl isomerase [Verrucomicrobiales bacterium]